MDIETAYGNYKSYLHSVAYHLLGSTTEAEDVVQELFTDLYDKMEAVQHLKTYLTRAITNRCLNLLQSARRRREVYPGTWLPEPIAEDIKQQPDKTAEQQESLSYAYMLMMETMEPLERVVLVLREAYDYSYQDIALITGKTEANCRKIYSRARKKLNPDRIHPSLPIPQRQPIIEQFVTAFQRGDASTLVQLLSVSSTLVSDGGGKVRTAVNPIFGGDRVLAFLLGVSTKRYAGLGYRITCLNGMPNVLFYENDSVVSILLIELQSQAPVIQGLYFIVNPDKINIDI